MSLKALVLAVLAVAFVPYAAPAQTPSTPPGPAVSWENGAVRGIQIQRGRGLDYLFKYTVVVPEGTAASYAVSVDVCKWVPVKNNVPSEIDSCVSGGESPVTSLTEVTPGRVFEGGIRFGYDPSSITFGKVNRFSYTLTLREVDGDEPGRVVATAEFNDVIFARKNRTAE
jgi:hypothetical protein